MIALQVSLAVKFRAWRITCGTLREQWTVPLPGVAIAGLRGTRLLRIDDRGVTIEVTVLSDDGAGETGA